MATKPGARQTSRDLERYAGLFAERTTVMRSSAMRDLMAITARPNSEMVWVVRICAAACGAGRSVPY